MKSQIIFSVIITVLCLIVFPVEVAVAVPIGTAFTYQGRLMDANKPADGLYDFWFKLYDDANTITGNQVGGDVNKPDVDVIDGYFTAELDFGSDPNIFNGDTRWLEIHVRIGDSNDPNAYSTLMPRQELTPTPYASYAKTAGSVSQRKLLRPVATIVVAASDSLNKARADYICDGVDDQVEIQAALDALPDGGGEVALSEGQFNISAPITVYKATVDRRHTTLRGRGFGSTTIYLSNNSNCNMIEYVGGAEDLGFLTIEDMTLSGNRDNQTSGSCYYSTNPAGGGDTFDVRLRNIFFVRGKEYGFYITGGWGVMIDNCITEHNGLSGGLLSGTECFINELHSAANDQCGLILLGLQLQVSNCRIDDNGQHGLKLLNLANSEITNCYIADWGTITASMSGLYMSNADKVVISNLVISGDTTTNTRKGIVATGTCTNNIINGCLVEDVYTNSINLYGSNNVVVGCNLEKGTDGSRAIEDDGTGNIYEHNYGSDEIATGAYTLQPFGVTTIDSSGGAVTGTLPSGSYIGQIKTIVMTDATASSTVSVTNHETSDPEVGTFDAIDETWVLMWTGTEWVTLKATCTFL